MTIGRIRMRDASTTARRSGAPSRRRWFAKSTRRMELDTTMPTMTIVPMNDSMLSVVPVASSTATTPISPMGTENMMMKGSRKDRNCATMTR